MRIVHVTLVVPLCIVQGTVVVLGHMCPWLVEGHLQIRWAAAHLEICTSSSWPLPISRILQADHWDPLDTSGQGFELGGNNIGGGAVLKARSGWIS